MNINYQIQIKAKNADWYERAKDFPSLEEFEKWDDQRTARFSYQLSFKFNHAVHSIEKFENASHSIIFIDEHKNELSVQLDNLLVIEFKGDISQHLIISESILEQSFIEKRSKAKTYVYCYIKENTEFISVSENILLSAEHINLIEKTITKPCTVIAPAVELILFGGAF